MARIVGVAGAFRAGEQHGYTSTSRSVAGLGPAVVPDRLPSHRLYLQKLTRPTSTLHTRRPSSCRRTRKEAGIREVIPQSSPCGITVL